MDNGCEILLEARIEDLEARLASQERALEEANTLLKEIYTYTDDLPGHLAIKVDGYVKPLLKGCGA